MDKTATERLEETLKNVENSGMDERQKAEWKDFYSTMPEFTEGKARIAPRQHSRRLLNQEPMTPTQRKERSSRHLIERLQLAMSTEQRERWSAAAAQDNLSLSEFIRIRVDGTLGV